jgi:hypothetical protein
MAIISDVSKLYDPVVRMAMISLQLRRLEREFEILRNMLGQSARAVSIKSATFRTLRGAWKDVHISDEDIQHSRLSIPDDLA